ncbi:unnamed protein product [Protopolystoma xenopodis]|uniref:Uncharacterized protein n=1 Tax=Protopolystoma xenopodis TaxID=117903 RepID=A0A448XBY3_9PLAT|nr:unnamed protein product [Protopolystoma xenopodis]
MALWPRNLTPDLSSVALATDLEAGLLSQASSSYTPTTHDRHTRTHLRSIAQACLMHSECRTLVISQVAYRPRLGSSRLRSRPSLPQSVWEEEVLTIYRTSHQRLRVFVTNRRCKAPNLGAPTPKRLSFCCSVMNLTEPPPLRSLPLHLLLCHLHVDWTCM